MARDRSRRSCRAQAGVPLAAHRGPTPRPRSLRSSSGRHTADGRTGRSSRIWDRQRLPRGKSRSIQTYTDPIGTSSRGLGSWKRVRPAAAARKGSGPARLPRNRGRRAATAHAIDGVAGAPVLRAGLSAEVADGHQDAEGDEYQDDDVLGHARAAHRWAGPRDLARTREPAPSGRRRRRKERSHSRRDAHGVASLAEPSRMRALAR